MYIENNTRDSSCYLKEWIPLKPILVLKHSHATPCHSTTRQH